MLGADVVEWEPVVTAGLLLVILTLLGLLCVAGLVALVVWLARRTQTPAASTDARRPGTTP